MIITTPDDIGRKVKYIRSWMKPSDIEEGVITGYNDNYVFVRYGRDIHSKATKREHLFYMGDMNAS